MKKSTSIEELCLDNIGMKGWVKLAGRSLHWVAPPVSSSSSFALKFPNSLPHRFIIFLPLQGFCPQTLHGAYIQQQHSRAHSQFFQQFYRRQRYQIENSEHGWPAIRKRITNTAWANIWFLPGSLFQVAHTRFLVNRNVAPLRKTIWSSLLCKWRSFSLFLAKRVRQWGHEWVN